jgi:hypothetical protein
MYIKKEKETDFDEFSIKRPAKEENMKIKILFYLSYHIQEFILAPKLSELLGISHGTRPQILYHLWEYIKLNSLQDNENPKIVINNKQLSKIFNCEKMEISSLTSRLSEHLKIPPPIEIDFTVHDLSEDSCKNQILKDIQLTIDDPYCNSLFGFLSNANEESLLFPKRFFSSMNPGLGDAANNFGKYLEKINEIEKQYSSYMNIMKRHKYYYDFFDAYEKDPILFIDNFMIQQNELIKRISDQTTSIVRADYNSSQYYKDYEEVVTSRPVLDTVIRDLNLDTSYSALVKKLSVSNPTNTRFLRITVTDKDVNLAKAIADEVADVSARFISEKMDLVTVDDVIGILLGYLSLIQCDLKSLSHNYPPRNFQIELIRLLYRKNRSLCMLLRVRFMI